MIHDSPSEIYHYALPFSPSSSWLHESYSSELSHEVKVVKGLQVKWGACSRTVFPGGITRALACWRHLIAVGLYSCDIAILDAITGMTISTLSGHTGHANCLAFSSDGTFLVFGSHDRIVDLWDIQTGGVIKAFHGHTSPVLSVSISQDCVVVASGSQDGTIHLWNTWTGGCHCIIEGHKQEVKSISFSSINSHLILSASAGNTVQQWDIDGHQIGPTYKAYNATFSPDGAHFIVGGAVPTVQNTNSGAVIVKLQGSTKWFNYCCLSSDYKFMAGAENHTIYVWDITNSDPYLVETFIGHTTSISGLTFYSTHSLISLSSGDDSIKFWQIGTSSINPSATNSEFAPPALAPIESISLQANNGIAISSDETGVVRTWDISTGLCKASFHTPAQYDDERDGRFIGGKLVLVWFNDHKIHVWESEKGILPHKVNVQSCWNMDIRISGDGSKIFILNGEYIQAWSLWTGEIVGRVQLEDEPSCFDSLVADGSRIWVYFGCKQTQGWDFGIPGSTPIQLSNVFPDRPRLSLIQFDEGSDTLYMIEDTVSGKEVFRLPKKYAKSIRKLQWDGQYLVVGYYSGEVLILDFNNMIPRWRFIVHIPSFLSP